LELLHGYLEPIEILSSVGIAVVIGENMKGTPGIAGRLFSALGRRGVNVIAIAQGSSELSISFAVKSSDVTEALQILHAEFQP
jgi:aspartokinase